jgi:hypothetical protein
MADSQDEDSADNSPFDHIIDDEGPRKECADWAFGEIGGGRSPEEVAADLVANGWPEYDAEEICERARKETRHLRAGTTRDDVSRAFGTRDPSVMRHAVPFSRSVLFGAVETFLRAMFRFRSVKNIGKRKH